MSREFPHLLLVNKRRSLNMKSYMLVQTYTPPSSKNTVTRFTINNAVMNEDLTQSMHKSHAIKWSASHESKRILSNHAPLQQRCIEQMGRCLWDLDSPNVHHCSCYEKIVFKNCRQEMDQGTCRLRVIKTVKQNQNIQVNRMNDYEWELYTNMKSIFGVDSWYHFLGQK